MVVITILDNITETSMPFNEFVRYRSNHFKDEKQILIIFGSNDDFMQYENNNLRILCANRNLIKLRQIIKSVKKECVNNNQDYIIHLHQVKSGFFSHIALTGLKLRKKTLFTVHSTYSGYSFHNKCLSFINALLSNRVTCVSKTSFNDYPKIVKTIKKDRILPIQNGVDSERINKTLHNQIKKKNKYIEFVYVARIIPIKNHDFLIEVLKRTTPKVKFIFIGNDKGSESIKEKCNRYNLTDRIEFTGLITREKVFQRVYQSDVYISSSTLEGMPISVLEAGYMGLPLVISDIPQHKELADGHNFIKLLPFDIDEWVHIINKFAEMSKAEREEIGKSCKDYIKNNFSLTSMHIKYTAIYKKM